MKKIDMYRAGLKDRYINPFVEIDKENSELIVNNSNFSDMISTETIREFMNDMLDREDYISQFIDVTEYSEEDFIDMMQKLSADEDLFGYIFESIDDAIVNAVQIKTYKKLFGIDLEKCGMYGDCRLTDFLRMPDRDKYEQQLKDICNSIIDDREHWLDNRRALSAFLNNVLYGE